MSKLLIAIGIIAAVFAVLAWVFNGIKNAIEMPDDFEDEDYTGFNLN